MKKNTIPRLNGFKRNSINSMIFLTIFGLSFLFLMTSPMATGALSEPNPTLENSIQINRFFQDNYNTGGFTAGGTRKPNWQDTLYALEDINELIELNHTAGLTNHQRYLIKKYILQERVTESYYVTENQTINNTEVVMQDLLNIEPITTNQTTNMTTNSTILPSFLESSDSFDLEQISLLTEEVIIEKYRVIDWWGGVKKSIEALRMLQLINMLDSNLITSVKNQILNHFASTGLNWQLDSPTWDDTYYMIVKASEYGLFNILPDLGLVPLTESLLNMAQDANTEDRDEILYNKTNTVTWLNTEEGQNQDLREEISTSVTGFSSYNLPLPRLRDITSLQTSKYPPIMEFVINWSSIFDQETNELLLTNFENRQFGIEFGALTNKTVTSYEIVTLSNGSQINQSVSVTNESWNPLFLDYEVAFSIISNNNDVVFESTTRLNDPSLSLVSIPLKYLDQRNRYFLELQTTQYIHEWKEEFLETTIARNSSITSEEFYWQLEHEGIQLDGITYFLDNMTILNDQGLNWTVIIKTDAYWVLDCLPVSVPFTLTLDIPFYGCMDLIQSNGEGNVYGKTSNAHDYTFWIWQDTSEDWVSLDSNGELITLLLLNGEGYLGVGDKIGYYPVLFSPLNSEIPSTELMTELQVYSIKHSGSGVAQHYLTSYLPLFNQSTQDLNKLLQQIEVIDALTVGVHPFKFVNEFHLLNSLFYHYNASSMLFEDNLELTLRSWQALDRLGVSDSYLCRQHYQKAINLIMQKYYGHKLTQERTLDYIKFTPSNSPVSELGLTHTVLQTLRYNATWLNRPVSHNSPEKVFPYTGIAVNTREEVDDSTRYIEMAKQSLSTRLYDPDELAVIESLIDPYLKEEQQIMVYVSTCLTGNKAQFMYWIPEEVKIDTIDSLTSLFFTICMILSFFAFLLRFYGKCNLSKIGFALLGIICLQGLSLPYMLDNSIGLFSNYLKAFTCLIHMLEDSVCDFSSQVSGVVGVLFTKPPENLNLEFKAVEGGTQSITESMLLKYGNTTKEVYNDYLKQYDRDYQRYEYMTSYDPDGGTQNYAQFPHKLSYVEYLQNLGELHFLAAYQDEIAKQEQIFRRQTDGVKQRQLILDDIIEGLAKSTRFSDELLEYLGGATRKFSDFLSSPSISNYRNFWSNFSKEIKAQIRALNKGTGDFTDLVELEELSRFANNMVSTCRKIVNEQVDIADDILTRSFNKFVDGDISYLLSLTKSGKGILSDTFNKNVFTILCSKIEGIETLQHIMTKINRQTNDLTSVIFKDDAIVLIRSSRYSTIKTNMTSTADFLLKSDDGLIESTEKIRDFERILADLDENTLEKIGIHLMNKKGNCTIRFHAIEETKITSLELPENLMIRISDMVRSENAIDILSDGSKFKNWFKELFKDEILFDLSNPENWPRQALRFFEKLDLYKSIEDAFISGNDVDSIKMILRSKFKEFGRPDEIGGTKLDSWVNSLESIEIDEFGYRLGFDFEDIKNSGINRKIFDRTRNRFKGYFDLKSAEEARYISDPGEGLLYDFYPQQHGSTRFEIRIRNNVGNKEEILKSSILRRLEEIAEYDMKAVSNIINNSNNEKLLSLWTSRYPNPQDILNQNISNSNLLILKTNNVQYQVVDLRKSLEASYTEYLSNGEGYGVFLKTYDNSDLINQGISQDSLFSAITSSPYQYLSRNTVSDLSIPSLVDGKLVYPAIVKETQASAAVRVFMDIVTDSPEGSKILVDSGMISRTTQNAIEKSNATFIKNFKQGNISIGAANQLTGILDGLVQVKQGSNYIDEFAIEFIGASKGTKTVLDSSPYHTVLGDFLRISCLGAIGKKGMVVYPKISITGDIIYTIFIVDKNVGELLKKAGAQFATDLSRRSVREAIEESQQTLLKEVDKIFKIKPDLDPNIDLLKYSLDNPTDKELYSQYLKLIEIILGVKASPMRMDIGLGNLWNNVSYSNDTELQNLVDITIATVGEFPEIETMFASSKGYFAGDVGDASLSFLANEFITKVKQCYLPTSIDSLNEFTTSSYQFTGLVNSGIKYDSESSNPYQGEYWLQDDINSIFVRSRGDSRYRYYPQNSWDNNNGCDFAVISKPGIELLTGSKDFNIVEYPYFVWTWKNDPWYLEQEGEAEYIDGLSDYSETEWNQGQISFLLNDGLTKQWVGIVSTPDRTPNENNLLIGPTHALNGIIYVEPIVSVNHRQDDTVHEYTFEAPFIPEEINLLKLARDAGLSGDQIVIDQIATGIGPYAYEDFDPKTQDLHITNMAFVNKQENVIDALGQGVLKGIYDVHTVDMSAGYDNWSEYLEAYEEEYDNQAFDLAVGSLDGDNGNAYDWVIQAKQADLHDEFRFFYTSGVVILRNSAEAGNPVRGLFVKTKKWSHTSETLVADLYTSADIDSTPEVPIYLDPIYDNGWPRDLWMEAAFELESRFSELGYNSYTLNAEQLAEYMTNEDSRGMVIILGAIPETIWSYYNPKMMPNDMTTADWIQTAEDHSILEHYLEHGGMVLSTGQYGGGWNIAFYDTSEQKTLIGSYDSVNNPLNDGEGVDLNVDIGDILWDQTFSTHSPSYDPTTGSASHMTTSSGDQYYPDIGNYYSFGLRDLIGSQVVKIADGGVYADSMWLVKERGQDSLEVTDGTGSFITFHTGRNNVSAGAINEANFDAWADDLIEVTTGIDIVSTSVLPSAFISQSLVPKNSISPLENDYYWYDSFINSSENWNGISRTVSNDGELGIMSGTSAYKDINLVNVSDYPTFSARFYDNNESKIIADYSQYSDWTSTETLPSSLSHLQIDRPNNYITSDDNSAHQFYYVNMQEMSSMTSFGMFDGIYEQGGYKTLDVTANTDTFFHMAINPVLLNAYEPLSSTEIPQEDQWDKYEHASEWWMELEIDDGSGENKKIRYFFTVETPMWYKGAIVTPNRGYLHDEYYYYDYSAEDWQLAPRSNTNQDGIRWVNIPVSPDYDQNRIWDLHLTYWSTGDFQDSYLPQTTEGQWSHITRNIVMDYNTLFQQNTEHLTVVKATHNAHISAGQAYVLVDDFVFYRPYDTDWQKQYYTELQLSDGQHTINLYYGASNANGVTINNEFRQFGDVWINASNEYCYATGTSYMNFDGSYLTNTQFNAEGWVEVGGFVINDCLAFLPYLPDLDVLGLFYQDKVSVNSWTSGTKVDDIVIGGLHDKPINSGDYYINNQHKLVLKVDTDNTNAGVEKIFDEAHCIGDYNLLSFDIMVTETENDHIVNPYISIKNGTNTYRAELSKYTSVSSDLYFHLDQMVAVNRWYHIDLNLMALSDSLGEFPTERTLFDEIEFVIPTSGTFWLDNVIVAGRKGVLFYDDFDDRQFSSNYTDGSLSENHTTQYVWKAINDLYSTVTIEPEHDTLMNSPIIIDVQESEQILTSFCGEYNSTLTLRLYAYKEDGTKVTSGVTYLDVVTTNTVLQGFDQLIDCFADISSLDSDTRFLGCPEIINATGKFEIISISDINPADSTYTNGTSYDDEIVLDDVISGPRALFESFEYGNINDWSITRGTGATFNIDNGVISVDGGTSGDVVVRPQFPIMTENFEIKFKSRVVTGEYTGWVIGNGYDNYLCELDINDPTFPKVDIITEGSIPENLIGDFDLNDDIAVNEWVIFKIRLEGSQFKMWINGQQVMDITNDTYTAPYDFGFRVWNTATAEFADLSIEPITTYDLLSQSEEIITSEPIKELPIAYWDLTTKYLDPNDDPTDGEVYWLYDTSGNETQYNSKTINATFDEDEGCYALDGTDDVILIPMEELRNSSGITITSWHHISDDFVNNGAPFSLLTDTGTSDADGFWWHIGTTNNNILVRVEDSGGEHAYTISSITTPIDQWISDTWVIETDSLKFYRNGQLLWSQSTTFNWSNLNNDTLEIRIGQGYSSGYYYKGLIGSLGIFDYALTAEEIVTLYQPDLSLIEPDSSVTIDNVFNTENWAISGAINLETGTSGDLFTLTIGGEELVITAEELNQLLSFNASMNSGSQSPNADELDLPMDEGQGSTVYDQTSYGRNGTLYGATWSAEGDVYLDGQNDRVYTANLAGTVISNPSDQDVTWAFEFNQHVSDGGTSYIISSGGQTGSAMGFYGLLNSSRQLAIGVGADDHSVGSGYFYTITKGQWYSVYATYEGSATNVADKELNIYINGTHYGPYTNTTGARAADNYTNVTIGVPNNGIYSYEFRGYVRNVKIWNSLQQPVIGGGEGQDVSLENPLLYTGESSLLLSLPLTEVEGSIVKDYSLYTNDGSLQGDTTLTRSTGVHFDGSGDYIAIPNSSSLKSQQGTVAAWVKPSQISGGRVVFASGHSTSNNYYCMMMIDGSTGMPQFYMYNNGSNYRIGVAEGLTLNTGEWHHLVWQSTGTEWKAFVDGTEFPITMGVGTNDGMWFNDYNTNNFAIGVLDRPSPYQYFDGYIRNAQIWNRVLNDDEIKGLANTFNLREGDYGSTIPFTIYPLNDIENRIAVRIGSETLYLINSGSDTSLSTITIDNISTSMLELNELTISTLNEGYLVNLDGTVSSVNSYIYGVSTYERSNGVISSNDLISASDQLGFHFTDISRDINKGAIISVEVQVSCENPANGKLYLKPGNDSTGYSWDITDNINTNPAEVVLNGGHTILQINTHAVTSNHDELLIYLEGGTGYSTLSIGRITVLEVDHLDDCSVDNLIPADWTSSVVSEKHGISYSDSTLILSHSNEGNSEYYGNSIVTIPTYSAPITTNTCVSFDWYLGAFIYSDPTYSYDNIIAGVALPCINDPLVFTFGEYYDVYQSESVTFIPNFNDWNQDDVLDYYNQWVHTEFVLSEYSDTLSSQWQDSISIFIDGAFNTGDFQLQIRNLQIYEKRSSILAVAGQRVGENHTDDFYITDWIASPMYQNYEFFEPLPQTNLIRNASFEDGYDSTTFVPDQWNNMPNGDAKTIIAKSTVTQPAFSGQYYVNLEIGEFGGHHYSAIMESTNINAGQMEYDTVLISFWYQIHMDDEDNGYIRILLNENSIGQTPAGNQSDWTYYQTTCALDGLNGFYLRFMTQELSSPWAGGYVSIDEVRVEPVSCSDINFRGFDPLNLNEFTFWDGWYTISNVDSNNYINAADTTAVVTRDNIGHTQYFYTTIWVDSQDGLSDESWQLTLNENVSSNNVYGLWINNELITIEEGGFSEPNLTLHSGFNSILFMQKVENVSNWNTNLFRVHLERSWGSEYTVRTVRPKIHLSRAPIIYYDSQHKTKWINRDGSNSDLLLDLSLGEGTGSKVIDHSFNDNDGTIVGATWDNYDLTFNGSGDYIAFGDQPDLETQHGTVTAWVKIPEGGGGVVLASSNTGSIYYYMMLMVNGVAGSTDNLCFYAANYGNPTIRSYVENLTIDDNEWHYISWTCDGSSNKVFLDETEYNWTRHDFTHPDGYWFGDFGTNIFNIGMMNQGGSPYGYFTGSIQGLCVRDRVLTQDEILDCMLGQQQGNLAVIDTSSMLASSIASDFRSLNLPARVVNSERLGYYIDAELNMYSNYVEYQTDTTGNSAAYTGGFPWPDYNWGSPNLMGFWDYSDGQTTAEYYLKNHPETDIIYWTSYTYELLTQPPLEPVYRVDYYGQKTTRSYDFSRGGKTIWHPFGSILSTTDVLPDHVFNGSDNSPIETYLELGGKLFWSGGYIPFSYFSADIGQSLIPVSTGSNYDYDGARGHQRVLDLDSLNNDAFSGRSDFSSGMFISGHANDDYDGTEDEPVIDEDTPPDRNGVIANLDDFNYEPYMVNDSSWTQLPHIGYSSHMVVTKHEYDVMEHIKTDYISDIRVWNGDGESDYNGVGTAWSHQNPADLTRTLSSFDDDSIPEIPSSFYAEQMIDPLAAQLWMRPYLVDFNGAYEYSPPDHASGVPGYYGWKNHLTPLAKVYYYHYERANVGTGLVQAGTNAKGMIGVMPMFDWSSNLNGLHTRGSDAKLGLYSDRGKGSITNSPTTESIARKLTTIITSRSLLEMYLESIQINVCRDNSTVGTNFLNFGHTNALGQEPEQNLIGQGYDNNGGYVSMEALNGPLTVATFTDNYSSRTWDDYLCAQSSYGMFGDSYAKAVANNQVEGWINQTYGEYEYSTNSDVEHADFAFEEIGPEWDNFTTLANIDNAQPIYHHHTMKTMTANALKADTDQRPVLYTRFNTINNDSQSVYSSWYDVNVPSSNQPLNGYNFGIDHSGSIMGYERAYDTTAVDLGWSLYNPDLSAYNSQEPTISPIYASNDNEMVLRNALRYSYDSNSYYKWIGGPITTSPVGTLNSNELLSLSGGNSNLHDGDYNTAWTMNFDDTWGSGGVFIGSDGDNCTKLTIDDGPKSINIVALYLQNYNWQNIPQQVKVVLYDENNKAVYSTTSAFAGDRTLLDDTGDGTKNRYYNPPPLMISIPSITASSLGVELWSFSACYDTSSDEVLSEVEVYSWGSTPASHIYSFTDTENVARFPELDSDQSPGIRFDNGDDSYIDNDDRYYSRPRQYGGLNAIIGIHSKDNEAVSSMRYNFYYNSSINFTSNLPSYKEGNIPQIEWWDILETILNHYLIFFFMIIIVNIVASLIPGLSVVVQVFDYVVLTMMCAELSFYGQIGYLTQSDTYKTNTLFRMVYDIVYDWDASVARMVVPTYTWLAGSLRWN